MSETEPVLEPVPVTKDVPVINGNSDIDSPPPEPELTNGLNKSEMEVSNGVDDSIVNGDNVADGEPGPVNGDCNGPDEEEDLMGEDELPPPPEIVPDLPPPPPQECETQDLLCDNDPIESSVDPVIESSVDQMESNVDQVPDKIGDVECVDENEDLMNVSDSETAQEEVVGQNIEIPKQEEVSEEELVSDGGLRDEVEVEIQNNQENEEVEQGQLIDLGEPQKEEEVPAAPVEPSVPLVDLSEPTEPELPPEPVEQSVEEIVAEPEEVQAVHQEPVNEVPETLPEPEPVFEPESVPVEEPVSVPVVEQVVETPQEPEREPSPVPEPTPVIPQEPEVTVQEPTVEEPQQPVEENIPQVAYSEPAIVVDNKPAEEEAEVPPPPPPPLIDETPPPPPPLDENIPLRRVSGSSTPNKQSPSKEIESPLAISAPMNVAVVSPQPEPVAVGQEIEQQPEPVPVPVKTEPLAPPPQSPHPVAVVAPQVVSEEASPPTSSSPDSPTATSEQALSEGEKPEAEPVVSPQVSQKINKKNFKSKIKFGVDLVEASLKQLHFLYNVNKNPGLYEEWLFKKAIRRYEAFWLPLAAEHKKESLAAPLDIEWVWHCHILAPLYYEADSKSIAGLVVEHKLMSEKDRTKSLEKSRKYWTAKYPNEPFEIDLVYKEKVVEETPVVEEPKQAEENSTQNNEPKETENKEAEVEVAKEADVKEEAVDKPEEGTETEPAPAESNPPAEAPAEAAPVATEPAPAPAPTPAPEPEIQAVPEEDYVQKSSYNIFAAIARQRVFFYQVSLPHFHDKHFLKSAQKRYQRFLFLKHQNPTETIVPCYDIDVMWHSHQLHPSVYKHDTVKVLGQILKHDDSVNDRSTGSLLMRANQKTRELWKEHFGDSFTTFGAMFRGEPPILCERMSMIEPVETYAFSTKKATVNLDKVQVEGLPEEINKYSVKLAYGGYDDQEGPLIKQFKGNKKKIEFENTKKGLAHFVFDTKEYDRLKINMSQQIGFACTGHNEEIGAQILSMMPVVENIPKDQSDPSTLTETVKIDIDEEQNMKATFSATIEPPKQGPTMLYMNPGNYESRFCIMPEQIVQMWGPIPLPRLPAGRDNQCIVASHKFVNHTGETTFTCRVIHSLPLLMSAIQVFYHSRMAAVAHLVGSDQIPQATQLSDSKKIFSLNPADGQRAVLLKNQQGDWGLLRGQWTGFRKHQPPVAATKGKKAKKEVPWNPGTLSVSFFKCATGAWQHLTLPYLQENFKFTIQDANIDLRSGSVEVNSESNEVAENLALGFSVALLHVMCQPRYKPPPPPEPIPVTVEPPPPSPEAKEAPKEEEEKEKPADQPAAPQEGAEGEIQPAEGAEGEATAEKPTTEEEKPKEEPKEEPKEQPKEQPKTPKSPAKSEPPTPSKKMKEVPPIPTFELGLVLAAGYNIDVATNDNIKKQYGGNACAGCAAQGFDTGVGMIGEAVADTAADAETLEVVDNAGEEGGDAGDHGDDGNSPDQADMMDMDAGGMDGMGDMGDAGAASCAAF